MAEYCRHYQCQCEAAADLVFMSNSTADGRRKANLLASAYKVLKERLEVRCRMIHRMGAVTAPFPGEDGERSRTSS